MKTRVILVALSIAFAIGTSAGCSTASRGNRKRSVAIAISVKPGNRLSPSEVAEVHRLLQPEIERRGYVMARSSRSAEYFVHVRYPVDPLAVAHIRIVRAKPNVPFLKDNDWQPEVLGNREYKRAMADMVTEPK